MQPAPQLMSQDRLVSVVPVAAVAVMTTGGRPGKVRVVALCMLPDTAVAATLAVMVAPLTGWTITLVTAWLPLRVMTRLGAGGSARWAQESSTDHVRRDMCDVIRQAVISASWLASSCAPMMCTH